MNCNNEVVRFCQGVLAGYVLAHLKVQTSDIQKKISKIQKVHFICHIEDDDEFNLHFPDFENCPKVQPGWKYFKNKKIIKIDLGEEIVKYLNKNMDSTFEYIVSSMHVDDTEGIEDFLNVKENGKHLIDILPNLFFCFGKSYIYIDYLIDSSQYINVYEMYDEILSTQFEYTNSKEKIFNCTIKRNCKDTQQRTEIHEDITDYFKCFINNDVPITLDKVLYNLDSFDEELDNIALKLRFSYRTAVYLSNEPIQL